jgi:hypothetical protein
MQAVRPAGWVVRLEVWSRLRLPRRFKNNFRLEHLIAQMLCRDVSSVVAARVPDVVAQTSRVWREAAWPAVLERLKQKIVDRWHRQAVDSQTLARIMARLMVWGVIGFDDYDCHTPRALLDRLDVHCAVAWGWFRDLFSFNAVVWTAVEGELLAREFDIHLWR